MKYTAIIIILVAGSVKVNAQQLASEKPLASFYSKTTRQNLDTRAKAGKPAASLSRQQLPSAKALPQPSAPRYKPAAVKTTGKAIRKPASD